MVHIAIPKQQSEEMLKQQSGNPLEQRSKGPVETTVNQMHVENFSAGGDTNIASTELVHSLEINEGGNLAEALAAFKKNVEEFEKSPEYPAISSKLAEIEKQAEQAQAEQEKAAQGKAAHTKTSESIEKLQETLRQYILQESKLIAHNVREANLWFDCEVVVMKDIFPNNDNEQAVERKNVTFIGNPEEKDMANPRIPGDTLLIQPMLIDGVEWTALKIPASIKEMKLSDLSEEFMEKKDKDWFPEMDMTVSVGEALGGDWLILAKHNKKTDEIIPQTKVNIKTYDKGADTDVVRECLREGTKPMGLAHTLVLREIIKQGLGDKYVHFNGYRADSDEAGYQQIRARIDKIDEYTGLSFGDKDGDYIMIRKTKCIIRTLGVYRDKKGKLHAFIRGGSDTHGGAGGVASLNLDGDVDNLASILGFRQYL